MPTPRQDEHNRTVRKISTTLQGPVFEVLGELVPEVRRLPRRNTLEALLDDIDLLHRCFLAFRTHPDRFRHLLVDKHKVAVADAEALLECGRSLDQIVAMVVRTAAKRHFRSKLDGSPRAARPRPLRQHRPRDLLSRLHDLLMAEPAPYLQQASKSRAEALYDAFQTYLRHDWQIPMIPEYCQLSATTVRRLGPRILDYRLAEDIRRLRADPDNPPPPTAVLDPSQTGLPLPDFLMPRPNPATAEALGPGEPRTATPTASFRQGPGMAPLDYSLAERVVRDERAPLAQILSTDGKRLKADAFTLALLDPQVRAAIPHSEQTVRITSVLSSVNGLIGKMLVGGLGLRLDQLAVFLMGAHAALGEKRFETAFGIPGRPEYVGRIIERAKALKIDQGTPLPEIATFITQTFKIEMPG